MDLKNLEYFVGKVCTIFTVQINRDYHKENPASYPQQLFNYFVGVVEEINEYGLMLRQIQSDRKSFYFVSHIVGIAEEEVLDPYKNAEEITKIKEADAEYRKILSKKTVNVPSGEYVDPKELDGFLSKINQDQ